ncbi:MAG: DnaJ C-terminal domain-containing protein [Desulfobulbus sp.]
MEYKDYYKILGLERTATPEQIKQAYRKAARKYHPDVSKEADAEARFKDAGEAYEVLKDPEKRAAYDQFGANWREGQPFEPPPGYQQNYSFYSGEYSGDDAGQFSDFFESLFGRSRTGGHDRSSRSSFRMRGEDQYAKIRIDLADSYHGAQKTINLARQVLDEQTGRVHTQPQTLHVSIPKGLIEGQHIRLEGQGLPGYGGEAAGDLFLEILFEDDPLFHAEKRDIHMTLPVAPWEAALGATVTAPTLGGPVQMTIPPGSQSGGKLRLRGKGLSTADRQGDQIVTLRIIAPIPQTEEQRQLYRTMAEKMTFNPRAGMEH